MNVLAVDTSSDSGSVVVQIGDTVAAALRSDASIQYSEHLFDAITRALAEAGTTLDQIDVFTAVRGPGSFTGLRVGLATMDGFAFSEGKATAGVSTLAALAWQVGVTPDPIVPMLDARHGEIYSALYERKVAELVEVSGPTVLQPAELFAALPDGPMVFCGPGAEAHREAIESRSGWRLAPVSDDLARVAAAMVRDDHREPLEPLYVRKTSAEVERARRSAGTGDR